MAYVTQSWGFKCLRCGYSFLWSFHLIWHLFTPPGLLTHWDEGESQTAVDAATGNSYVLAWLSYCPSDIDLRTVRLVLNDIDLKPVSFKQHLVWTRKHAWKSQLQSLSSVLFKALHQWEWWMFTNTLQPRWSGKVNVVGKLNCTALNINYVNMCKSKYTFMVKILIHLKDWLPHDEVVMEAL